MREQWDQDTRMKSEHLCSRKRQRGKGGSSDILTLFARSKSNNSNCRFLKASPALVLYIRITTICTESTNFQKAHKTTESTKDTSLGRKGEQEDGHLLWVKSLLEEYGQKIILSPCHAWCENCRCLSLQLGPSPVLCLRSNPTFCAESNKGRKWLHMCFHLSPPTMTHCWALSRLHSLAGSRARLHQAA